MNVTYTFIRVPGVEQVRDIIHLYETAGWWMGQAQETPELIRRIVAGSHCFVLAHADEQVIGMGRVISDGVSDAYLQDVTVLPGFRRHGIGTGIVAVILRRLRADGLQWIGLIAGGNSHPFYRKLGFEEMPAATAMLQLMKFDGIPDES